MHFVSRQVPCIMLNCLKFAQNKRCTAACRFEQLSTHSMEVLHTWSGCRLCTGSEGSVIFTVHCCGQFSAIETAMLACRLPGKKRWRSIALAPCSAGHVLARKAIHHQLTGYVVVVTGSATSSGSVIGCPPQASCTQGNQEANNFSHDVSAFHTQPQASQHQVLPSALSTNPCSLSILKLDFTTSSIDSTAFSITPTIFSKSHHL